MNFPRIILNFASSIFTTYNRTIYLGLTVLSMACAAPILAQTEPNLPNNTPDQNASESRVPDLPEAPSLSETINWSRSATDLQPLSQNLSPEPNPKELLLNKKPKSLINTSPDPNYIIPPRIAPKEKINPGTTTLPLNDIPISHLTEWQLSALQAFAETTNSELFLNGTLKIRSRVIESLTRDNIYTVDQRGSYFQLRTVPLERNHYHHHN